MNDRYDSVIVDVIVRVMIPLIQLFGLYVLVFGHYSPGGGFQAGALLAASVLLARVSLGRRESQRLFPVAWAPLMATAGILIYLLTGLIPMLFGGSFLDYAHLPLGGLDAVHRRYEGIFAVELGVTLAVAGVLILIYDSITREE
ncbi:MAG TPA: Na(+)/H(+) antiporter subunit B [Bacillota bacterium]